MRDTPESRMPAVVYHDVGDVRVEQVPAPAEPVAAGELLLRVHTVGVCGTDAGAWAHGGAGIPVAEPHRVTGHHGPTVLGHEFSATVAGVGPGVDERWLGELVCCCGAVFCGECRACAAGRDSECENYSVVGLHRHGALAHYVSAPAASCIRIDRTVLSPDEAALGQPMSIAVHAARRGAPVAGEATVVLGVGGIGAFLVHVLSQWGLDVTAVDLNPDRLAVARELGAARTVRAGTTDDVAAVLAAHGERPRLVYEVTGSGPVLVTALELAAIGGRVVLVGMQAEPVEVRFKPVALREQTLIGTNSLVPGSDLPEAIRLLSRRRGGWDILAPDVLPLSEVLTHALAPIAAGRSPAIKVLVDPAATERRAFRAAGET